MSISSTAAPGLTVGSLKTVVSGYNHIFMAIDKFGPRVCAIPYVLCGLYCLRC